MMMVGDGIIAFQMRGADIMEESDDAATLIWEFWGEDSHLLIDAKGVFCQSSFVSMVVVAVGREVIALVEIGNDVADALAIDITQQRDDFLFDGS